MRKIAILTSVVSLLLASVVYAADPNEPNTARAGRFGRGRGMFRSESALINFSGGAQQMVVSLRLGIDANSFWLFPVKCKPEQVKFSLAANLPQAVGLDSTQLAVRTLDNMNYALILTQLWTIPIYYFGNDYADYRGAGLGGPGDSNGVKLAVFQADSAASLVDQLKSRGRIIQESQLEPFAKYLNKDYALLTVWREGNEPNIADRRGAFRRRAAVNIEFPSEKPFYPLISYGGRYGRVSLTLTGYWKLADHSTNFDVRQQVSSPEGFPDAFKASLPAKDVPVTICSMFGQMRGTSAPAAQTTELQFVPGRVEGMEYPDMISKLPLIALIGLGIVALAVISYISAGISGLIAFKKWPGFAEFGLYNILTIIALGIAMNYKKGPTAEAFRANKPKARLFVVCFSILVVAMSFGLFALAKMPLNSAM